MERMQNRLKLTLELFIQLIDSKYEKTHLWKTNPLIKNNWKCFEVPEKSSNRKFKEE